MCQTLNSTDAISAIGSGTLETMTLTFAGELDIATTPALRERLAARPLPGAPMLVDLREVTFMDCSALHVLLDAHMDAVLGGWELSVAVSPGPVRRLLELTGADRRLTLASGPAELAA